MPNKCSGIPPVMDLKRYLRVEGGNNEVYNFINSLLDCGMIDIPKFEKLIKILLDLNIVGERLLRFKAEFNNDQNFMTTTLKYSSGKRFKKYC